MKTEVMGCVVLDRFVTCTDRPLAAPTAVSAKATVVGAMSNVGVPVPLRVMVPELTPLTVNAAVVVCAPTLTGWNA